MKQLSKKRVIAAITSLFMLFSMLNVFPSIASAAYSKANMDMVYLGNGDTPAASPITTLPNVSEMNVGDKIWIGINLSNLPNIELNTNPNGYDSFFVKGSELAGTAGIYNLATGYNYLTKYLKPIPSQNWGGSTEENIANDYGEVYWQTYEPWTAYAASYQANVTIGAATQLSHESASPTVLDTNYDIGNVYIDITSMAPLKRVYNTTLGDELMASVICFQIQEVPPAGLKVLEASLNAHDFILQTGTEGMRWGANWNKESSVTETINLNNYFVYGGAINLNPATYQVKFYNDYNTDSSSFGTLVKTVSVPEGTSIKTSDIPKSSDFTASTGKFYEKLNYVKAGDTPDPDTDNEFDPSNPPSITSDIDVYATYVPGHTVTFDSNYPSGVTTPTATTKPVTVSPAAGTTFDTTDEPTVGSSGTEDFAVPTGYSFKEWNTQPDGNGTTIVFGTGGTDISAVNTVHAIWSKDWKIEFQKVEGSVEAGNVLDTEYMSPTATDTTVLAPSDPSRTGYKFNGWYYYNGGTKTTFIPKDSATGTPTQISGDTTIYADWIKQVTVRYYDTKANATTNDGSTGLLASETVDENTLYTDLKKRPATTDNDTTHKYFKGWTKTDGTTVVDFTDTTGKVTDDLVVYQDWGDYYKLEFYEEASDITNGTVYDTKYVNPHVNGGKLAALPTNPTKDNFGFNKWLINGTSTEFTTSTTVSGNMILVADWTAKITITFHSNDGSPETKSDPIQITPNVNFDGTAPTYTRSGYTFKEWNTESNGSGTAYASLTSAQFSASDDLYAIWTAAGADQSTLTFDANLTGVTPNPSSVTVNTGDKVYTANIPVVSKDNYKFDGWYESASITDTTKIDFDAGYTVSEKKTVYAHWTYTGTDKITVTFMNDSTPYATIDVAPNTTLGDLMPANPTKSGYTFKEWNTASNGTGTTFDKNTNVGAGPATVTVYAQYVQDITVTYDTNGGNNDGPGTVKKPAGDTYVDPTTLPTRAGYTFIGWNTKQNGSGTYVKAANVATYAAVSALFDGSPSTVQLYAQWAAVPDTPNDKGKVETDTPTDPDPAKQGVKVTFDSNALGSASQAGIKDASPKYKYPQYGDTIGTDNMPEKPERPNYKFKGWNTKADGSGVTVDGTIAIGANLGDAIKAIENTTTAYEVTLYAQWQVAPDYLGDKVTVTFNKNTDGKGTDAAPTSIEIVKGDSLGYLPTDPTNGDFSFDGWFTGSANANGKIEFTGNKLTATTPINDTTTYYAQWSKMLVARMQTNTAVYTGQAINPLFDIYEISYPDTQQPYVLGKQIASGIDPTTNPDYKITYYKGDPSVTEVKDVGTYTFKVDLEDTSALAIAGASIAVTDYEKNNNRTSIFTVTPKLLTVKVNPDTQIQKAGATVPLADVTIDGLASTDAVDNVIEKKYYKWTPADSSDTTIEQSELAEEATPTAIAKYVLQVTVKSTNKNYKIDSVVSSKDGTPVLLYEKTATSTYPAFNILSSDNNIVPGTNIVYVIQANDPSASISVKPGNKDTGLGSALSLYDTDYTTSVTFDDAEHPIRSDYYTRVSKDTDYVEFTVTPKNKTTVLTAPTAGTGITILGPDTATGAYTVKVDLTKSGATPNDITITTKAGNDTNAPTLDYNFHIQKLVEAKIVLNYGNSPYGEIMKDASITDKDTAKANFDSTQKLTSLTTLPFYDEAWSSYLTYNEGLAYNGDKDDTSIFVYQRQAFKDPGFKLYDAIGNEITDSDVISSVSLSLTMTSFAGGVVKYTSADTPVDVNATGSGNNYVFNDFKNYNIRPDVYKLTYEFTDPISNEKVKATRFVIAISRLGDAKIDANNIINNLDASAVKTNSSAILLANSLYAFRVADAKTDANKIINNLDASAIKTVSMSLPLFYKALPTE